MRDDLEYPPKIPTLTLTYYYYYVVKTRVCVFVLCTMNGEGTRFGALRNRPAVQTGFDVAEGAHVTSLLFC